MSNIFLSTFDAQSLKQNTRGVKKSIAYDDCMKYISFHLIQRPFCGRVLTEGYSFLFLVSLGMFTHFWMLLDKADLENPWTVCLQAPSKNYLILYTSFAGIVLLVYSRLVSHSADYKTD